MNNSTTPFLTVAESWPRLEPAMNPDGARTKHVKLPPSVVYVKGQIVGPVTATPGRYAAPGAGVTGPYLPLEYPISTDASGNCYLGTVVDAREPSFESVPVYWKGAFFIRDLTGIADDTIMNATGRLVQGTGRTDTAAILELR